MSEETSKLHLYSLGRATENIEEGTLILHVDTYEIRVTTDGEVANQADETEVEGVDSTGSKYRQKSSSGSSIAATWLKRNHPNRETPPMVRRGTEVLVYRYGDTANYFWETRDEAKLTTEVVRYVFSAHDDDNQDVRTKDNSYILDVDTLRKIVSFSTSKAREEKTRYDVQFDSGRGELIIQDEQGQQINVSSIKSRIGMITAQDAMLELIRQNMNMKLPGSGDWKIAKNFTENIGGNSTSTIGGSWSVTSKEPASITAPTISLNGLIKLNGEVECSASVKVASNIRAGGTISAPNIDEG